MFQAIQERPLFWDGLSHARRALDGRNGDWRMAINRLEREFPTIERAEQWARRVLGQRPGCPVEVWRLDHSKRLQQECVATVSRDALGRTWTDLLTFEPLL